MQAVQQCPKLCECRGRGQGRSNSKVRALRRIGDPRRESADGAVGQLAKNVLTFWELRPPLNAKTLAMERVKRVVNLDDLGTMGIMFLSRVAPVRAIWRRGSAWPRAGRNVVYASLRPRRWSTSWWRQSKTTKCDA